VGARNQEYAWALYSAHARVTFEARVDGQGRLTDLLIDTRLPPNAHGGVIRLVTSQRFSDFGVPVRAQLPPADQVQEAGAWFYR
jgi:hypothetical protein